MEMDCLECNNSDKKIIIKIFWKSENNIKSFSYVYIRTEITKKYTMIKNRNGYTTLIYFYPGAKNTTCLGEVRGQGARRGGVLGGCPSGSHQWATQRGWWDEEGPGLSWPLQGIFLLIHINNRKLKQLTSSFLFWRTKNIAVSEWLEGIIIPGIIFLGVFWKFTPFMKWREYLKTLTWLRPRVPLLVLAPPGRAGDRGERLVLQPVVDPGLLAGLGDAVPVPVPRHVAAHLVLHFIVLFVAL